MSNMKDGQLINVVLSKNMVVAVWVNDICTKALTRTDKLIAFFLSRFDI
jgi:hypothetical protein